MSLDLKSNLHQNNFKEVKASDSELYEFEDFRLDAVHLMLYRSGEAISLPPKQVETLLALVERSGEIISKDELMERLWADAFVEESNLNQNIYILRKILGETFDGKPMIETLRRRGYRFNGELKENAQTQTEIQPEKQPEETAPLLKFPADIEEKAIAEKTGAVDSSGRNRNVAALAVVLLLTGAVALGYYFFSSKNAAVGDKKSIAVLPLKPVNTDAHDLIYELGIAESLIQKLGAAKGVTVRPLSATRKYSDIEQDAITAGREQKVDYVLASNYQLANGKIRVTSQLINVQTGAIEETLRSEKDSAEVFSMQDAIAGDFGNVLLARFGKTENSPAAKRYTTNEDAYRLYLQGMYLVDKRDSAAARKAVDIFEQAVRLDPNYAQAWAGLAHAHRLIGGIGRSVNTGEEYQQSIEAINKALALDENLADAHSALCDNKMQYEWDFDGAERECKRAIELDPNSPLAHQIFSRYLNSRGRFDEAIAEIKIAIDLEPASLFSQRNYGSYLYFARRYTEAVQQLKRVIAMEPNFSGTYPFLWQSLEMQGNYPEAFEWFMKFQALQKADEETLRLYQSAYQTSGWQGVLGEQVRQFERTNFVYFHGAVFNARVGNKDKAFEYLEKSYQRRELWMSMLKVDPGLDSLRDDPRFDELVRRVGLK